MTRKCQSQTADQTMASRGIDKDPRQPHKIKIKQTSLSFLAG